MDFEPTNRTYISCMSSPTETGVILFEVVDMATRFISDTTLADMRSLVVSTLPAAVANVAE